MRNYDNLAFQRRRCYSSVSKLPKDRRDQVLAALKSAEKWHDGQLRIYLKRTPYIIHIYGVLRILIDELKVRDPKVLAAAALHDTIEDCGVKKGFLEKRFGKAVASLVASESQNLFSSRSSYMSHFNKAGMGSRLIKVADRIDNLRTMLYGTRWSYDKCAQYIIESERYIMPFARRTSVRGFRALESVSAKLKAREGIRDAYLSISKGEGSSYVDTEGTGTWTKRPVID
ncbi:MAG: bifunctional (p)ppGpp synthetase/guanosine-3',5'-bis(diphosphate) 3'-pyrophosphohydrolase [Candidatus Micrarchaeota archaeon]|nr:bifunctional (p)ppGpp synthetase/guanosine-3',5'-bis(diphosphate) 3'-pyrophosphohydrolase [Candidatus Micrarchaeota archaeon]